MATNLANWYQKPASSSYTSFLVPESGDGFW